jgi:hypothetical protein
LVLEVYPATSVFPPEERYGLQAQIRRVAVGVAATLVDLLTVAARLGFPAAPAGADA